MEKSIKLSKRSEAILNSMVKFEQWETEFIKMCHDVGIVSPNGDFDELECFSAFLDAANDLKDKMYMILRVNINDSLGWLKNLYGDTVEL